MTSSEDVVANVAELRLAKRHRLDDVAERFRHLLTFHRQ